MSLNTTPAEITRQATLDLAKKMSLEGQMNVKLRSFFRDVSKDLERSVLTTGGVQDVRQYRNRVQAILAQQGNRVTESFVSSSISSIRQLPFNNPLKESLRAIARVLGTNPGTMLSDMQLQSRLISQQELSSFVVKTTEEILATTQKQLIKSLQKAENNLGPDATNRELAKNSSTIFRVKSAPRPQTISTTYTQQTAENAKFSTQEAVGNVFNSTEARELGLDPVEVENRWVSQGDSRVRDGAVFNHLNADFQIRENGVFNVSGQTLRFPGDTSRGATAANVVKCRCASIMTLEEKAA